MTDNEKELLHRIEKLEGYVERLLDFHVRQVNLNRAALLLMAQKQGVDLEQLFDEAEQVQALAMGLVGEVDE